MSNEQTDLPEGTSVAPEERNSDPFGDSMTFEVTSEIDTYQLEQEISERVGKQVHVALEVPLGQIASKEHPATLYVSPGTVDGRTVRGAIVSHVPAQSDQSEREVLVKKLTSGETLTQDDITSALKLLLGATSEG
jgi:hypothetical protein